MPETYFHREGAEKQSLFFALDPESIGERLHFLYYHPRYQAAIATLEARTPTVALADVVREPIRRGVQPEYTEAGEVVVLKTVDLKNGRIDYDGALRVSREFFEANEGAQVQKGDVLVTSTGFGSMGKVDIYDREDPAIVDGHIAIVRPHERYDAEFLCFFLRSRFGAAQFDREFSGSSGQIELQPTDLGRFRVPSPEEGAVPLKLQIQIAQEISAIEQSGMGFNRDAQAIRDELADELPRELGLMEGTPSKFYFHRAAAEGTSLWFVLSPDDLGERLNYLFYHPRHDDAIRLLEAQVELVTLGSVVEEPIRRGVQPEYTEAGEVVVLKTVDLKNGRIDYDGALRVSREFFEANEGAQVQKGDVLVTSTGYGSMGKVDVYDREDPAVISGELLRVRMRGDYDPYFVCYFLRSHLGSVQFDRWFSGSSGQIHLYEPDLSQFLIPSPEEGVGVPIERQRRIAESITSKLNRARMLEERARQARGWARERFEEALLD